MSGKILFCLEEGIQGPQKNLESMHQLTMDARFFLVHFAVLS